MTRERWLKIADWIDSIRGFIGALLLAYLMAFHNLR
jgi:hypothetical protein